ncbi:MAG: nitrite/sulfite reductase, partial [bacterium]|nr:nitrite/sulfite reductase [bacterium]
DLGFIANMKDGKVGFEFYVGGGLGAVPHQAKMFADFLPAEEVLPMSQAVCRVFARLGEKQNRARARVKFLLAKLGLEEFQRLVNEERKILPHDDAWTAYLADLGSYKEEPLKIAAPLNGAPKPEGFDAWVSTNVYKQRQDGYVSVTVCLPLGDITSDQTRALTEISRKYLKDTIRTTVEQNIILRWVSESDLVNLYRDLFAEDLGESGAGTIVDVTACPGTDTCKLGISSSRGLAAELRTRLAAQSMNLDASIRNFRIKISGCFNSCGQHHVADLGFYGNSRKVNGYTVPHFQVVLGGQWTENAGSYGLAMGAVPSKNIPAVIERITGKYVADRQGDESFQAYVKRIGKLAVKNMLTDLATVPAHEVDPSFYIDWGESREFTVGDMGKGECAGEVVTLVEFELSGCETESFEAQLQLDEGNYKAAYKGAYGAMLHAAKALIKTQWLDIPEDPNEIVNEFRARFCDTQLFYNQFAGPKFANYLFRVHDEEVSHYTQDIAHRAIEEGQLFIEQAYACYGRMNVVNA